MKNVNKYINCLPFKLYLDPRKKFIEEFQLFSNCTGGIFAKIKLEIKEIQKN